MKVGGVGLVLLAALVWTQWHAGDGGAERVSQAIEAVSLAKAPVAAEVHRTEAPKLASTSASTAVVTTEVAAARIENLPTPPSGLVDRSAAKPPAAPANPAAVVTSGAKARKDALPSDERSRQATESNSPQRGAAVAKRTEVAAAPAPLVGGSRLSTAPRPAAPTAVRAGPNSSGCDADVDIVTALMTHIDGRPPAPSPRGPTLATCGTAQLPAAVGVPDNIADLVASCRGATADDTLACRWRICKGYWGKAEACPVRDYKAAERAARLLQARGDS